MRLMHWTHLHTFLGGAAVGLALAARWWLLLAIGTGAVALGVLLGVGLAAGAWRASGWVARLLEQRRQPLASLIPPDAEIQVIARPRPSRYAKPRI